jgi:hypothetical protein
VYGPTTVLPKVAGPAAWAKRGPTEAEAEIIIMNINEIATTLIMRFFVAIIFHFASLRQRS